MMFFHPNFLEKLTLPTPLLGIIQLVYQVLLNCNTSLLMHFLLFQIVEHPQCHMHTIKVSNPRKGPWRNLRLFTLL